MVVLLLHHRLLGNNFTLLGFHRRSSPLAASAGFCSVEAMAAAQCTFETSVVTPSVLVPSETSSCSCAACCACAPCSLSSRLVLHVGSFTVELITSTHLNAVTTSEVDVHLYHIPLRRTSDPLRGGVDYEHPHPLSPPPSSSHTPWYREVRLLQQHDLPSSNTRDFMVRISLSHPVNPLCALTLFRPQHSATSNPGPDQIQGGDPTGTGRGATPSSAANSKMKSHGAETYRGRHPRHGHRWPNTNGASFTSPAPTPWLDGKHSIFGRVSAGMRTIQRMGGVPCVRVIGPRQRSGSIEPTSGGSNAHGRVPAVSGTRFKGA